MSNIYTQNTNKHTQNFLLSLRTCEVYPNTNILTVTMNFS